MHGLTKWLSVAAVLALYTGVFLALLVVKGVQSLAQRTAPSRVWARLAQRRADLVEQRTPGARESRTSTALASAPAATEAGVGPATRARLLGVDELLIDDSDEEALFI